VFQPYRQYVDCAGSVFVRLVLDNGIAPAATVASTASAGSSSRPYASRPLNSAAAPAQQLGTRQVRGFLTRTTRVCTTLHRWEGSRREDECIRSEVRVSVPPPTNTHTLSRARSSLSL
jgi:hypothetical protein